MKWIRWAFNQKSTSGEWEREKQIYLLLLFASLKKKNIWVGELHGKRRADWKGKVMDFIQTRAPQPPGPYIYDDRLPDCVGLLGQ